MTGVHCDAFCKHGILFSHAGDHTHEGTDEALGARCFFAQEVKPKAHVDPQVPYPCTGECLVGL